MPNEVKEVTLDLLKDTSISDVNKKHRGQLFLELTYAPFREDSLSFSGVLDGYSRKDSVMDRALSNISTTSATGLLLVTVQGAQDVEGSRHNNPYVLIIFRGETKKSKVVFISDTIQLFLYIYFYDRSNEEKWWVLDVEEDAKSCVERGVPILAGRTSIARQDSCEGYEQKEPQLPL